MNVLRLVLILSLSGLISCASYFKRKSCEQINWFEHGKKVALSGQRLNSDTTLNECRKVEAEISETQVDLGFKNGMATYCTDDRAYMVGKSGDLFSRDLCEGPRINLLVASHKKGIQAYCEKSNGYNAGSSGKKYQNVCPSDMEKHFLPEYKKGRRSYVQSRVQDLSLQVREKDLAISSIQTRGYQVTSQLRSLESRRQVLEARRSTAMSIGNVNETNYLNGELSSLDSQISTYRGQEASNRSAISNLEQEKKNLNTELSQFREELATLN